MSESEEAKKNAGGETRGKVAARHEQEDREAPMYRERARRQRDYRKEAAEKQAEPGLSAAPGGNAVVDLRTGEVHNN